MTAVADGRVHLRSNVANSSDAWNLVPGELVAIHRRQLLRRHRRPPQLQLDERMYYTPCGVCGRFEHVFMREGCDTCSHGPTPHQMERARALHRESLAAVEEARRQLDTEED